MDIEFFGLGGLGSDSVGACMFRYWEAVMVLREMVKLVSGMAHFQSHSTKYETIMMSSSQSKSCTIVVYILGTCSQFSYEAGCEAIHDTPATAMTLGLQFTSFLVRQHLLKLHLYRRLCASETAPETRATVVPFSDFLYHFQMRHVPIPVVETYAPLWFLGLCTVQQT